MEFMLLGFASAIFCKKTIRGINWFADWFEAERGTGEGCNGWVGGSRSGVIPVQMEFDFVNPKGKN